MKRRKSSLGSALFQMKDESVRALGWISLWSVRTSEMQFFLTIETNNTNFKKKYDLKINFQK
jgi:RNAse (barnase) inhibitor barstar